MICRVAGLSSRISTSREMNSTEPAGCCVQMNRIVGIGNDIIHIPRVKAVFEKYGDRFLKRMCHPEEITAFKARQTQQHGDSAFTLLATLYVCL